MAGIAQELKAGNEDLISLSVYTRSLTGLKMAEFEAKTISVRTCWASESRKNICEAPKNPE